MEDHQDLLWTAAKVEVNKEKAERKVDYHTTRMFPTAFSKEDTWLKEMSEGIHENEEDEKVEDEDENVSGNELEKPLNKPKTKKQRRKEKAKKAEEEKRKSVRDEKLKNQDVFRLKGMKKMMAAQEALDEEETGEENVDPLVEEANAVEVEREQVRRARAGIEVAG